MVLCSLTVVWFTHTVVYPYSGYVCYFLRGGFVCPQSVSVCCLMRVGGNPYNDRAQNVVVSFGD